MSRDRPEDDGRNERPPFLSGNASSLWTPAIIAALTAITFLVANLVARLLERADV